MPDTVLLTGITGFIAKRIAFDLLLAGYAVTGTVRTPAREAEVRATLAANGLDAATLTRLRFLSLDLNSDAGWADAMTGVNAVIHTASPFPIAQPKDENVLIRPAVDGTLRVLKAAQAAGVQRVVLTSSMEAVMHGHTGTITEKDWSDLTAPTATAYTKSKTLAEKAAWDFVAQHPEMQLTAINPGMVLGTPMDRETGSSVGVVKRFLTGKDPMVPDVSIPMTDVADVSAAHVAALKTPASIGQRYMVSDQFLSMPAMTGILKAAYPQRRIATRIAPRFVLRLLSLFDAEIRAILPWVGWTARLDNSKIRHELGIAITPAKDSILATARFLDGA
ncbi:MAG: NAD-dependent epimerase/dehydratase family protein [Rhodobacterales bacterium]|nr:MAG: NAD-dependent epimerase/dehydratase family protein [Rhodobacterales bacterium]